MGHRPYFRRLGFHNDRMHWIGWARCEEVSRKPSARYARPAALRPFRVLLRSSSQASLSRCLIRDAFERDCIAGKSRRDPFFLGGGERLAEPRALGDAARDEV